MKKVRGAFLLPLTLLILFSVIFFTPAYSTAGAAPETGVKFELANAGDGAYKLVFRAAAPSNIQLLDVMFSFDNTIMRPVNAVNQAELINPVNNGSVSLAPFRALAKDGEGTVFSLVTMGWRINGNRTAFHISAYSLKYAASNAGYIDIFEFYFKFQTGKSARDLKKNTLLFETPANPNNFFPKYYLPGTGFCILLKESEGKEYYWGAEDQKAMPDSIGDVYNPFDIDIVDAEVPHIASQPLSAAVSEGEDHTLYIRADIFDGGILSYQWFQAVSPVNSGGAPIQGETKNYLYIPACAPGIYYYYVEVTNTNNSVNGLKTATITSGEVKLEVARKTDVTPPVGSISIGINTWDSFSDTPAFELFCNTSLQAFISAEDDSLGEVAVYYYLSGTAYSLNELDNLSTEWKNYTGGIELSPNNKYILYAKLADPSGNTAYVNTCGMVVYTDGERGSASAAYTKGSETDVGLSVILNGNTINKVMSGVETLVNGVDYTSAGGIIDVKYGYLETLETGSHDLTVFYNPMGILFPENPLAGSVKPAVTVIPVSVYDEPATVTGVVVSPASAEVQKGSSKAFTAAVYGKNSPPQPVAWSVSGNASTGTVITIIGFLSVASDESAETLTVTARSTFNDTVYGSAAVIVTDPPSEPGDGGGDGNGDSGGDNNGNVSDGSGNTGNTGGNTGGDNGDIDDGCGGDNEDGGDDGSSGGNGDGGDGNGDSGSDNNGNVGDGSGNTGNTGGNTGGGSGGGSGGGASSVASNADVPDSAPQIADEETPLSAARGKDASRGRPASRGRTAASTAQHKLGLDKGRTEGYISGYLDGTFRADNGITRYEAAYIFYSLLPEDDKKLYKYAVRLPPDVESGQWYSEAVSGLIAAGVINGYLDGFFRGDNNITRAELATIACKFEDLNLSGTTPFFDVPGDHWAYAYIISAYNYGWITGYPDGTFGADKYISRAETIAIINKMLGWSNLEPKSPVMKEFTDIDGGEWYSAQVTLAANGIKGS